MATALSSGVFNSTVSPTDNPLVARYTITVPDGSQVSIQFGLTTAYGTSTWQVDAPAGGGEVSILVAGMLPSTTYHMAALIHLRTGTTVGDSDHTFTTGALPTEHLPALSVTTNPASGAPCPGVELVNLNPLAACVADLQGNIIWYYLNQADLLQDGHPMPMRPLSNGNMMALITNRYTKDKTPYCVLREFDLAGDTVSNQFGLREINMTTLNTLLLKVPTHYGRTVQVNYYSHDFYPLTNGHVILLCQEFLTLEVDGKNTLVWGDALVDLDDSFTPVWVWSEFDVLDVNRHPYEWLPDHDWTHCNTIEPTPDGNLLLGVRNQSWVLKLHYANGTGTGEILWKMGFEGDFTLMRGGQPDPNTADWFFAQHYPHILTSANGYITSMTVVDNGNYRAGTYPNPYSRGLIVNVDEQKKTVEVAWQYPDAVTPEFYSYWGGNVVQLPNGNMEICMARPLPADPKPVHSFAREVTFHTQELVWQLDITPPYAYRSYRIPSLYPGVRW